MAIVALIGDVERVQVDLNRPGAARGTPFRLKVDAFVYAHERLLLIDVHSFPPAYEPFAPFDAVVLEPPAADKFREGALRLVNTLREAQIPAALIEGSSVNDIVESAAAAGRPAFLLEVNEGLVPLRQEALASAVAQWAAAGATASGAAAARRRVIGAGALGAAPWAVGGA